MAGHPGAELDRLEEALHLNDGNSVERRVLEFIVQVLQGRLQDNPSVAPLQDAGVGTTTIREVGGITVLATLINRVTTLLAVPLNEAAETLTSQWYFDALQPILRTLLSGWQRYATPSTPPLDVDAVDGPLAPWTRRLQGTCGGTLIQTCTRK